MQPEIAKELLKIFSELGAFKLTVLGGEISLYDVENNYANLMDVLTYARMIGYRYVRIDTNGQKNNFFENRNLFMNIDEISFSIDGYDDKTNDILRGKGAFLRANRNLLQLKRMFPQKKINITSCVTKQNTSIAGGITEYIEKMIDYASRSGVEQLNFHGVFKMGVPMDTWTGDSHLDPKEWYKKIGNISENIKKGKYMVDVRFPIHLVSRKEFEIYPRYYGYCPCKLGERALIHPDGIIRVCSSMLSTPFGVAHYNNDRIEWNEYNNELKNHKMGEYTPCTNQRNLYSEELCPVCFSLKPFQNEVVWKESDVEKLRG